MNISVLILLIIFLNIAISFFAYSSKKLYGLQRTAILIWIWIAPIVGAASVLVFLYFYNKSNNDLNEPQWYGDDGSI
jgi:hypothetical protein